MTEAELQAQIIPLANSYGLLVFHSGDSRRDTGRGFPDLTIASKHGLMYRELKDDHGDLSSAQATWKWTMLASGTNWGLWRPIDWRSGAIEAELRGWSDDRG